MDSMHTGTQALNETLLVGLPSSTRINGRYAIHTPWLLTKLNIMKIIRSLFYSDGTCSELEQMQNRREAQQPIWCKKKKKKR